jgi:hypothetical protein
VNLPATPTDCDADLALVGQWVVTPSARVVRRHAAVIYTLLRSETEHEVCSRASVNFLKLICLCHCAVLIWIYQCVKEPDEIETDGQAHSYSMVEVDGITKIPALSTVPAINDFVQVFKNISARNGRLVHPFCPA